MRKKGNKYYNDYKEWIWIVVTLVFILIISVKMYLGD